MKLKDYRKAYNIASEINAIKETIAIITKSRIENGCYDLNTDKSKALYNYSTKELLYSIRILEKEFDECISKAKREEIQNEINDYKMCLHKAIANYEMNKIFGCDNGMDDKEFNTKCDKIENEIKRLGEELRGLWT